MRKLHISKRHAVNFAFAAVLICIALNVYSRRSDVQNIGVFNDRTQAQRAAFKVLSQQMRTFPQRQSYRVNWEQDETVAINGYYFDYQKSTSILLFSYVPQSTRSFSWRFPFVTTRTTFNVSDQCPKRVQCKADAIHEAARRDLYLGQLGDVDGVKFFF